MTSREVGWIGRLLPTLPRQHTNPETDVQRAERLLLALASAYPEDVDWAAHLLLPPCRLRSLALIERNAAIRAGLSFFMPAPPKTAARRLVKALKARTTGATWRASPTLARLCDKILERNAGNPLKLRRVIDIAHEKQVIGAEKNGGDCTDNDAS